LYYNIFFYHEDINFLYDFREYLKERVNLEKNFAKDSSNLIQKYTQKFEKKRAQSVCYTPSTPNPSNDLNNLSPLKEGSIASPDATSPATPTTPGNANDYSYMIAWKSILNQMEAISKARITFSEKVTDNIIEKLKQQVAIKDEERKKYLLYHKNILNEIDKTNNEKQNARKKYIESTDVMSNHQKKLTKQDSSVNEGDKNNDKGKKKMEKLNDVIESAQIDINNKKNLYILSLEGLNTMKRKIRNEFIPEIYNNLQDTQESLIRDFQTFSREYIRLEQNLSDDIKSSFDITNNNINSINPGNDNNIFENENKKEYVPEEDEKYQGVGDNNGEFVITDKSSIFLSNTSASLQSQLEELSAKFCEYKREYDQFMSTYGNYVNDPTKMDAEGMRSKKSELLYNMHMSEIPIIINQSKIESISNAIGNDVKYNSHNFKSVLLINSTHCDYCQEKLRGKAIQCKDCSFTCHPKCEENVPRRCTGIKMDRKVLRIGTMADSKDSSLASPLFVRTPSVANSEALNPDMVSSPVSANNFTSPLTNDSTNKIEEDENEKVEIQEVPEQPKPNSTSKQMCAIFEYQPQNNDEVALSMNEKVEVIEDEVDGWVKVKTEKGEGFVPSSYIAPIKTALYSYEPDKDDEIAINEGDSVVVLGKEDAGWLKIKKGSLEGIVPESYIDM